MHLHLDAIGGVAGDMFVASLTDAFPDLRPGLSAAVRAAGLPEEIRCAFEVHNDGVLSGSRFRVEIPERLVGHHAVGHTAFAEIKRRLESAALDDEVKQRAIDIFHRLAVVEAGIHGTRVEEVGFHELGGWDSIADMVGAAWLISQLKISSCSVSKLPLGSGRVKTAHGPLPVPTPAVSQLLAGYEFVDDGVGGERITPTGAAILCHLLARQSGARAGRLGKSGYGFGTKRFSGISNVLRALVLEQTEIAANDRIGRITFEIDDQTPEDLAIGLDRVRAHEGVVDVLQSPTFGKKGRMLVQVQVLVHPAHLDAVCEVCLTETTTLGVRHEVLRRRTLTRTFSEVEVEGKMVRVKLAHRSQGVTAKPESDDMRSAGDQRQRAALRATAQARALKGGS